MDRMGILLLLDETGQPLGILCVGIAITKLKQSLLALKGKNKQLEELAQHQAHQIRGPISTLMMALELFKLEDSAIDNNERIKILNDAVLQTDASINDIINEYLNKSQKKSPK